MITITRLFARQLRSVLRRAGFARPPHGQSNAITFIARPDGLRIRAALSKFAIECRLPSPYEPVQYTVPYAFLAACEGGRDHCVNLNLLPDDKVRISWQDHDVPMSAVYEGCRVDEQAAFPVLPDSFAVTDATLLPALRDAAATSSDERTRFVSELAQRNRGMRLKCARGGLVRRETCVSSLNGFLANPKPPSQFYQGRNGHNRELPSHVMRCNTTGTLFVLCRPRWLRSANCRASADSTDDRDSIRFKIHYSEAPHASQNQRGLRASTG